MEPFFSPRPLPRPGWARFVGFAAASVAVHAAVFVELESAARRSAPTFDPASQTLQGDTLDVDPSVFVSASLAASSAPLASSEPDDDIDKLAGPAAPRQGLRPPSTRSAHDLRRARGQMPSLPPALFGAVGVRAATDVATAFTRAFPQAASADSLWFTAPLGPAGLADVTLVLDDAGSLVGSRVDGAPPPALRRGIARTIALLGTRLFTAHAPVTRLRVVASVARDDVHDGLHGDVFALSGGSFAGDVGSAFFALPAGVGPGRAGVGRRVDISLRLGPNQ